MVDDVVDKPLKVVEFLDGLVDVEKNGGIRGGVVNGIEFVLKIGELFGNGI